MANPPTIRYNNRGYEATYDPASDTCAVVVRGFIDANGKAVERGGPAHPDDKVLARFTISSVDGRTAFGLSSPVRDTFHDALADRRDLLGAPVFRHKPADDAERRLFAAAFDAAQKVRSNSTILGVNKLLFSLCPSLFAVVDCFSHDKSGAFWLMMADIQNPQAGFGGARAPVRSDFSLPLAAYILEAGEYVPSTATVRLGVWSLAPTGPRFAEIPNDRAAARDAVIAHLCNTPF